VMVIFSHHIQAKKRSGYVLIWVLILLVVIPIFAVALLSFAMNETLHATRSVKNIQNEFVARSGAEIGFRKLVNGSVAPKNTMGEFVTGANALGGLAGELSGSSYTITYSEYNPTSVKITSTAINLADNTIQDTVSIYMNTLPYYEPTDAWSEPPEVWYRSNHLNLWDGIDPDSRPEEDARDMAVAFTGAPTQSPQQGEPSVFRAAVMQFRGTNNKGITFRTINTNPVTLATEIILFYGSIEIKGDGKLILSTDGVLNAAIPGREWTDQDATGYDNSASGFETRERYFYYIEDDPNDYDPEEPVPEDLHPYDTYQFEDSGSKYGLLYIDGLIDNKDNSKDIGGGWYFFKNGIDLNSHLQIVDQYNSSDEPDLINITDSDPIKSITMNEKQGKRLIGTGDTKLIYEGN